MLITMHHRLLSPGYKTKIEIYKCIHRVLLNVTYTFGWTHRTFFSLGARASPLSTWASLMQNMSFSIWLSWFLFGTWILSIKEFFFYKQHLKFFKPYISFANGWNECSGSNTLRPSTSPPFYNTIFTTSHKSSWTTSRRWFRSPRNSPHLTRILKSRYCSACSDIPNFNTFVCWSIFWFFFLLVVIKKKYGWELIFIYPDKPRRPSGDISTLNTQDVWPEKDATIPPGADRTSCKMSRLSSEALSSNYSFFLVEYKWINNNKTYIWVWRPWNRTYRHGMRGKSDG